MTEEKVHGSVEFGIDPDDQNHTQIFQNSDSVYDQKHQEQRHL